MVVSLVAILIIVFLTPIERSLTLLEVIPVSLMVSILCLSLINYLDCKRRYEFKVKEIKFRLNELDRLEQELD